MLKRLSQKWHNKQIASPTALISPFQVLILLLSRGGSHHINSVPLIPSPRGHEKHHKNAKKKKTQPRSDVIFCVLMYQDMLSRSRGAPTGVSISDVTRDDVPNFSSIQTSGLIHVYAFDLNKIGLRAGNDNRTEGGKGGSRTVTKRDDKFSRISWKTRETRRQMDHNFSRNASLHSPFRLRPAAIKR